MESSSQFEGIIVELYRLRSSLLVVVVDGQVGVVRRRLELIPGEDVEGKRGELAGDDAGPQITVGDEVAEGVDSDPGEVDVADDDDVVLAEKGELHKVHGGLPVGPGGLPEVHDGPDDGEKDGAAADDVDEEEDLLRGDPVAGIAAGFVDDDLGDVGHHLEGDDRHDLLFQTIGINLSITLGFGFQVVHPADLCFKLPDNVSLEEGAMCEPLSVGIHACRRANIGPETTVLIMGAGPIGLVTMLAARAFGAPRIVIVDVDGYRLSVAKSLGADEFVKVFTNTQDLDEDVIQIQKAMGRDIDVSFDCAGFSKTMSTALNATRPGGKVCLVGMGHNEMTVPLTPAAAREVDVVGIFRYKDTWPLCIEFLRSGKIDVKPLITHRFGFSQEEVVEAFEVSARGGDAIKVMFNL